MGQRLVINLTDGAEQIASLYYHWSAYTTSALMELLGLAESIDMDSQIVTAEDRVNRVMDIIRYAESNGGGIDGGVFGEEGRKIQKLFPLEKFKDDNINRNDGLVAITPLGIQAVQSLSEGDIWCDVSTGEVENDVLYFYDSLEELRQDFDDIDEESIKELPYNISHFNIVDIFDIISFLDNERSANDIYTMDGRFVHFID